MNEQDMEEWYRKHTLRVEENERHLSDKKLNMIDKLLLIAWYMIRDVLRRRFNDE